MKYIFTSEKTTPVDVLIDAVLKEMQLVGVNSSEYPRLMTNLEGLYEIKRKDRRNPVSPDTLVMVGGNLMLALIIVAYEQKHVMTSKGLSLLTRPKGT